MHLSSIRIAQFRNIKEFVGNFSPGIHVIEGQNGQGKTNLIEAIHWLAHLRAFRTNRVRDLVRWKERELSVEGTVVQQGLNHQLRVAIKSGIKKAYLENKTTSSVNYSGHLSVVLFTPSDLEIVRGTPEVRRRFLDRSIFNTNSQYLPDYLNYRHALDQRNAYLRKGAPDILLQSVEVPMAKYGFKLMSERMRQVNSLQDYFTETFSKIMADPLDIKMGYRSFITTENGQTEEGFLNHIIDSRESDRERGFSQRGPHTDDITLKILGHSAKGFASQGQQRAVVLSLKIAEILNFKQKMNEWPVLLLDDVSSELDREKNRNLFQFLNDFSGQVFITTTDSKVLNMDQEYTQWTVAQGNIERRGRG